MATVHGFQAIPTNPKSTAEAANPATDNGTASAARKRPRRFMVTVRNNPGRTRISSTRKYGGMASSQLKTSELQ